MIDRKTESHWTTEVNSVVSGLEQKIHKIAENSPIGQTPTSKENLAMNATSLNGFRAPKKQNSVVDLPSPLCFWTSKKQNENKHVECAKACLLKRNVQAVGLSWIAFVEGPPSDATSLDFLVKKSMTAL